MPEITGKTESEVGIKAGLALAEENRKPITINGGEPFLLVPDSSGAYRVLEVEQHLPAPSRIRQDITFADVKSFCAYLNEFKDRGTKIFGVADLDEVRFDAVLDYHLSEAGSPGDTVPHGPRWGSHKISYPFPQTPEWQEILGKNGQPLKQVDFAHMVERLVVNFKDPNGATMLELARTLEARTEGEFKSSMRLDNGDRELLYTSRTEATAGRSEKIMIPQKIVLYVQPFIRGPHFQVEALFRYRIVGSQVTFEYELIRPHDFIDQAVQAASNEITEATDIKPLFGRLND